MKRILAGLGLPFLFALALFPSPSFSFAWQNGDTIYVDKNATGNGSGISWGDAFTSIKEAVLSVNPGTQVSIFVAQGVYYENHIILSEGIKLYGSFEGHESSLADRRDVWDNDHWTVIDAERKHRVLNMKDKTEVNGFILRNGLRDHTLQSGITIDDTRGGGIYIECDDDVVVRNNIIEHCAVFWQGGGIFIEGSCNNTSGAPLIEFNVIRSCTGYCGGGIEIAGVPEGAPGGTDAIIRHNVLRNNPDGGTSELGFGLELWTEYDDQCSPRMGDFYNNIIIGFRNKRDWNIDAADVWVWARNSSDRSFISQEWYLGEYLYDSCYKFGNPDKHNIFGSDPMFVDEANRNYRLRDGSPCIGAGRGGVNIGLFPDNRDTQSPVISSVASKNITSSGATIAWATDELSDSQVEYGFDTKYGSLTSLNSTAVKNHSVPLSGLAAATTYHYRVRSKDSAGNLAVSGDYSFATAAQPPPNRPPVAYAGTATTTLGTAVTGTLSASDPDGDALTYMIVTNGSLGMATITNASTGSYTYTPAAGVTGTDTFTFKVNDGKADSNVATVTVTINAQPPSPVRAPLRLVKKNYAYPGEGWDNAIDGDTRGWDGTVTASASPPYAIFAFTDNGIKSVSKVRLLTDTGVGFSERWVTQFTVQVSTTGTDASNFTTVLNKAVKNGGAWQDYSLQPVKAKYIKLILNQPSSGWRQIGEFEVYVYQ